MYIVHRSTIHYTIPSGLDKCNLHFIMHSVQYIYLYTQPGTHNIIHQRQPKHFESMPICQVKTFLQRAVSMDGCTEARTALRHEIVPASCAKSLQFRRRYRTVRGLDFIDLQRVRERKRETERVWKDKWDQVECAREKERD